MRRKIIDNIFEIISKGTANGIGQLYTEDEFYDKTTITFNEQQCVNFGSYSYLGLEHDLRLKNAAIDAIQRYGIQYPSSRTYVSTTLYKELEELLAKIFNVPIVLSTTTTLAHIAAMPVILDEGDVIIMDQQVHSSVQFMVSNMKQHGIASHIVRHNSVSELEEKILTLSNSSNRIWYMCDGVYSMYGDTAPLKELERLLEKHKKFHVYIDDAHGMSWAGKNGAGYVLSEMRFHPKMVLITSLNKAFAAGGAVIAVHNEALAQRIKTCGGPLIFAGQHQMSSLGAAIACAKIHLSEEINSMQEELNEKIQYCHDLLIAANLPVISNGDSPIFFVGVGLPKVGYNLVKKMMESGNYVNLAIFPAVAETCTGVRFTIVRNHSFVQIQEMVRNLALNFEKALIEEQRTIQDIYKAFRKVKNFAKIEPEKKMLTSESYKIQHETTVKKIDAKLWDSLLKNNSTFDWKGLVQLEEIFKNNEEHDNWQFHYFIIRNENNEPVFAAYATVCLTKDDLFAPAAVSYELEEKRNAEPYYLCSKTLMLGCPLSIGKHYFLNRDENWQLVLSYFIKYFVDLQDQTSATAINFRDIRSNDIQLNEFMQNEGFIKVEMPVNYCLSENNLNAEFSGYLHSLRSDQRHYIKKRSIAKEDLFEIVKNGMKNGEIGKLFKLYSNVVDRSFALNLFKLPKKLFDLAVQEENWDVIAIKLKGKSDKTIATAVSYINGNDYHFLIAGLDYDFVKEYDTYSQLLYQVVKRSMELNCKHINFGFTTGQNKRKFGAKPVQHNTFVQLKDKYSSTLINMMGSNMEASKSIDKIRTYSKVAIEL